MTNLIYVPIILFLLICVFCSKRFLFTHFVFCIYSKNDLYWSRVKIYNKKKLKKQRGRNRYWSKGYRYDKNGRLLKQDENGNIYIFVYGKPSKYDIS